jgi:hypothetical protein
LVNVIGSTLMRVSEHHLPLACGYEISVPATKTFTNQVIAFLYLAMRMGGQDTSTLATLPELMEETIQQTAAQIEALTPLPGADRTLRMFGFFDAGQVWGDDEKVSFGSLRMSAGLGIAWISPLGPMKFSYAYPLNDEPGDRLQRFQFQIGAGF